MSYKNDREKEIGFTSQTAGQKAIGDSNIRELSQNAAMSYEDQVSAVASMWSGLRDNGRLTDADGREGLIHAIYTHTVSLVLQFQWSSWKPEQRNILECPMYSSLEGKYEIFNTELQERDQNWERLLKRTITAIRDIADKPWTNASITQLVKKELPQSYEECTKLKLWLLCEGGCAYLYRIYELAKQKQRGMLCHLIGNTRRLLGISDDARESSLDSNVKKAGFDQNVLDVMADMEMIAMNYSVDSFCIDKAKAMELSDGLNVVQRLRRRLDSVTKDFPMWKDCKHIIKTCSQMFVARLLTAPFTSDLHTLLYQFCVELIKITRRKDLSKDISKIMALACSAQHLHVCSLAARDVLSNNLPFVVENYVRALTAATNEMEEFRSDKKEDDMKNHSTMFSSWLLELAGILKENERVTAECVLTAFSLTPDQKMYNLVQLYKQCAVSKDIKSEDPWSEPSTSTGWSRDSHSRNTFLVKTSERLWGSERPSASLRASIVSVEVLEGLGLNPDLCQDFIVLLSGPRVKTLSWDMKWEVLEKNCQLHIDKTNSGPTIHKELTSVLDSLHLHEQGPSGSDDEEICSGIEKGYEPVYEPAVVNEQPLQFRPKFIDDYLDDFDEEDAPSKAELAEVSWLPASMRQKIRKRHRKKPGKVPVTIKIKNKKHNTRSKKIKRKKLSKHPIEEVIIPSDPDNLTGKKITKAKHILKKPVVIKKKNNIKMKKIKRKVISPTQLTMRIASEKNTQSGDIANIHSSDEDISLANIKIDNEDKMESISLAKILDSNTPPTSNIIYDSFAETCPDLENFDNVIFENPKMEPKLENARTKAEKETNTIVSDAVKVKNKIGIMSPITKLPHSVHTLTRPGQAGPLSSLITKLSPAPPMGGGTKIKRVANVTTSSAELSKNIYNIQSSTAPMSVNSNQSFQRSTSKLIHFRKPNVTKQSSNVSAEKIDKSVDKIHLSQDRMTEHEKEILKRLLNQTSLQITRKGESNTILDNFISNDRSVSHIQTKKKYVRKKIDKKAIYAQNNPKCVPVPNNKKPETNAKISKTIQKKQSYSEPVANTSSDKTVDANNMGIWDIGCGLLRDMSRFGRVCTANELLLTYAYSENFIDRNFDKFWLTEIDWIVRQVLLSFRLEEVNFINQAVVLFEQILDDDFILDSTGEIADEIRRKCRVKIKTNKVLQSLLNVFRRDSSNGKFPLRQEYCQSNATNLSEADENNFVTNSVENRIQLVGEQTISTPSSANSYVTKSSTTSPKIIIDGRINIPKNSVTLSHSEDIQAKNTLKIQSQSSIRRLAKQTPLNSSFVCENVVKTPQSPWEPSIHEVENTKKKDVLDRSLLINQQLAPLPAFSSLMSRLKSGSQNSYNSVTYEHNGLGHQKNMDISCSESLPNFQNMPSARDTSYTNISKVAISRAKFPSEISLHPVSHNINNNADITKQNYIERKNAISPSPNTGLASQEHSVVKMLLQRKIVMGQKYQNTYRNDSSENLSQEQSSSQTQDSWSHPSSTNERAQFQTDKDHHVHTKQVIQVVPSTNNRTPMLQIGSIRDDKISSSDFDNTSHDLSKTKMSSQLENLSYVQSNNKCQYENKLNSVIRPSVITAPILSQATEHQDVHSRNQKVPKGLIKPTGILKVTGKNASGFYVVSSTKATESKSSGSETHSRIDKTVYVPSESSIQAETKTNAQIRVDNLTYEAKTNISVNKIVSGSKMSLYMRQNTTQPELCRTETEKCTDTTHINTRISTDTNVPKNNKFSRSYACKKNRIISIDYPSDCSPEKVLPVDNCNFQKQTHKGKVIDQRKKISVLEDVPVTIEKVLNRSSGNSPKSCINNLKQEQMNRNKEDEKSKDVKHVLNNLPYITINKLSHKNEQPAEIIVDPAPPASVIVNNKTPPKTNICIPINNEAGEMLIGRKISFCNVSSSYLNNVTDQYRTQNQLIFDNETIGDKPKEQIKLITQQSEVPTKSLISQKDISKDQNVAQCLNSNYLLNKVTKLPDVTIVAKSLSLQNVEKIEQFDHEEDAQKVDRPPKAQKSEEKTGPVKSTFPNTAKATETKAKMAENNCIKQKKKLIQCFKQQQDAQTIMDRLGIPGLSVRKVSITKGGQPNSPKITENKSTSTQNCDSQKIIYCDSPTQESSFRSSECDAHQTKQELDEDNADEKKMYEKHFLPNKKITIRENAYENDMYENQFLSDKEIRTDEKPKDILVLDREKLDSLTIQQKVPISPTAMLKRQKIKRRITDCLITSAQVISLPWYRCDEVTSDCISTCDKYSDDLSQTPTKLIKDDTSIATEGKALKHFDSNTPTKIEMESPSKNKQFIGKRPGPKSKTMLEKSKEVENTECVKYELPKKSTKHDTESQSNSDESAKLEVRFQNSPETIIKQEIDIQNLPKDIPKEGMEYKNNCDQSIIQDIVLESTSDISPKHEMKLQINSKESPHEEIQFLNIYNSIETVPDITITNNPIKFRYVTTAEDKSCNENLRDDKNSDIESILENHIISKDISTPLGDDNELRNEGNIPDKMEDILDLEQFIDSIQETISENTIIIKEVSTDTSMEDVLAVTDNESENDLVLDIDENMTDIESILENHVIVKSNIPTVESNIEEHPLVSEVDMQNDLECETMGDNDDLNHDCDIVTIIEVEHDVEDTSVPITNNTDIIPVNKEIVSEIHETESYTKNNISRNSRNIIQFQNDAIGDIADVNSDEELLLISKKSKTSDNSTVVGLKDDIKSMSTLSNSENKIHMSSAVSYLQSQKCEIYKEVVERNTENNILKSDNVKDTTNNIVDVNLNVSDTNIMLSKDTTSDKLIDDTELRNVSKSETRVQNIENTYLLHSVVQTDSNVYDKPTARHKENISEIQSQITHTNFVVNSTDSNNTEELSELKSNTTFVNETESENEIKSDTSEEIDDIVEKISDIDVILGNNHFKPVSNTRDIFARPENTEKNVCTMQHEPMTLQDDPITLNKTLFEIGKLNSSVIVHDVEHHQSSPEILNNTNNSTSEIIENKEWSQNCKPVENIKGKENVLESNISSTPIVTGTRRRKQKSHIVAKSNKKQTIEIVQKRTTRNLVQKSKLKLADKKKHMKRSLKEIVLKSEDIKTKNIKKSLKDIVPKSEAIKRKKTLRDIVPKSEDIRTQGIKKSVNEKILNFDQIKPDIKKSLVETILKSEDTESVNSVPKKFHVEFPTAPPKSYFKVPLTTNGRARIINDDESRILLAHMNKLGEIDTDVQEVVLEDPLNIEEGHLEEQEGDSKLDLCAIKKKSNKEHPIDLTCSDDENDKISLKDKLSSVYSFPNNYLCHVKLNTKNKKKFNELIYPSLKNLICTPKIHRLSKAIMNKYMEKMESDSGETWATRKSLRNIAKKKNTKRVNKPKYTTPIDSIENPCGETGENKQKNKREMPQKTSEAIINSTTEETPSMVPNKKFITNIINIVPLKTAELSTVEEVVVSDSESDETSEPVSNGIKFKKISYFRPLLTRAQVKLIEAIKDPRTKLKYYKRFTTVNRKKLNITSQLTEEVICLSSDDESEKSEKQNFSNTSITTQKNHKQEIQPATENAKYVMPDIFESKAAKMVDLMKTSETVKTLDSKKEVDLEKTADLIKNVDPKISVDLKQADPEIIVHSENIADEIAVIVDLKMEDLKIISPTVKTIVPNIVISNKFVDLEMKADTIKTVDPKDQLYSKKIDDTVMTINTNILKKTVDLKTIYNTVESHDESIAESKVMKLPNSKIVDSKKTVYRKKSLDSEKTTDTVITTDFEIDDSKLIVGLKMAGSKKTFNFEKEADMMKTTNLKLPNFRRNVENTSDTMLAVDLKMVNLKKTVDSKIETDTTKIVDSDTVDWKEEAHTPTSLDLKTDKCKMTNDLEMTLDLAEIDISETRQKKNSSNSIIVGSVIHQKQKTMSSSETTASNNPCVKNEICIELRNSINLNNLADTEQPKQTFGNILKSNITFSESTPETGRERIQICDLNVITKPPHREKRKSFDTSDEKNKRMCLDEMSHLNKTCNANQAQFFKTYSKKHIPKNVDSWLKSNVTPNDRMDILTTKKVVKAEENIQVETEKDKDLIESDPDSLYTDLGNEIEDVSRDSYLNIILPDNPLVGAVSIHDTLCWDSTESDYSQDLITIPCNDLEKFECNENTLENPDTPLSEDDKSLCSIESEALFTENTSSNKLSVRAENKIVIPTRNSPIILDDSINNNCEILLSVPKMTDYTNKMIVAGKSTQQPKTNNNQKTSVLAKVKERTIGHKQPSQSNQDNNETKSKVTKKGFGNVSDRVYVTSGITESLFGISAAALSDIKPQPLRSSKDKENNSNATNVQVDSLEYRKAKKNIKSKGVETYLRPSPHFIDEFDIFKKYSQTQENNIFHRNILYDVLGLNNYNYIVPAKQTYMVQVVEVRQFHGYNVNQNSLTSANDIQTQQNENSPQSEDTSSTAPETPVSEVSERQENVPEDSTEVINTVKKTVITLPEDITPPQSTGSETSFLHHDQDISQNCSNIDCNADKGDTKIGKNLIMSVNNYGTKNNIEIARSEISEPVQISDAKFHVESTLFTSQKVSSEIAEETSTMTSIQNKIVKNIEKTDVYKNKDASGTNFSQETSQMMQSVIEIDIEKSINKTAEEHSENQLYRAAEETIQIEVTATAGHNIEHLVPDEFLDIDNTQITEDSVDQVTGENCKMIEENIKISDVQIHSTEAVDPIEMDEDPMMNIETNTEENCLITDSEVVEDDVRMLDTEITEDDYELSNIPEDDIQIDSQMIEDEFQMWDAQHNIPMANSEIDVDSTPMVDFTVPCAVISRASTLGSESQCSEPYDSDVNYRITDTENVRILESPLNEFLSFGTRERELQTTDVAYIDALNSDITELHSEVQDKDADKNIESEDSPFDYSTYPTISDAIVPAIQSMGTEPQVQFVLTSARPKPVLVNDASNLSPSTTKNKDFHANSAESNGCRAAAANEKPTIKNAMLLQQALAQILPPLQNQSSGLTSHQNDVAQPLFRFIQQGRSTSVTLVDKGQQSTSNTTPQFLHVVQNKLSGTQNAASSLADSNYQHGNQVIHIVNSGNQAKVTSAAQLFKRVNLLTSLTNTQVGKEQKMVQFVCKSADGKSIHLNSPHRGMVFRLQPVEAVKPQTPVTQAPPIIPDPPTDVAQNLENKAPDTEQEIRSRSTYEENYAKFIRRATSKARKAQVAKARGLPKFNQAFGKATFRDNANENKSETEDETEQANVEPIVIVNDIQQAPQDGVSNPNLAAQLAGPPLLIRKSPQTVVQQIKQAISPAQPLQTLQGGVIYTRQIPMNLSSGKTINLITVPNSEDTQKQETRNVSPNSGTDSPIIRIIQASNACGNIEIKSESQPTGNDPNLTQVHPVVTQMRIRLPMLSKTPQMIGNARLVRPYLQIQRNVIAGQNQPVYQQLVLTTAAPQHSITTPPQSASTIQSPIHRSEPNISSSTLEQLREFDMVFEQVKERSTLGDTGIDTSQSDQSLIVAEPRPQSDNLYQHSQVVTTVVNKKIVKRTISRPMVTCSQSPPASKYTESSTVTTYEETQSTTYAETEAVTNYDQVQARENWESETVETNEESETITTFVESEPMRFVEAPPLNGYEEPEPLTYQELQPVNYDDSISQPMPSYSESDSIRTFGNSQSTYVETHTDSSFSEPLHVNTYQGSPLLSYSDTQQTSYTESQPTSTHSDSNDKSSEFSLARKSSKKKKKKTPNMTCMVAKTVPALSPTKLIPTIVAPTHRHPPMTKPPPLPKPQEDDETTQRILYILAEYKDQLENCPDKDRPAPRRRNLALPVVPGERKRKKGKKTTSQNVGSPSDDPNRTIGSEDSSCGTSQADYSENNQAIDMPSPLGSPSKASRRYSFQQDSEASTSGHQKSTNTEGPMMQSPPKATTAVLMPGNYLLPVSMMKGGQQITIVTNQGQKILTLPQGDGASNALFLQRLVGAATLKTVQGKPTQILRPVQMPTINTQPMNLSSNLSNPILSADVDNTPCSVSPKIFMDIPTSDIESRDMPSMKDDSLKESNIEPLADTVTTSDTVETNTTEPLTKKCKMKPKKPGTVNLIQLHSLGSTEGSPTKVFSVGNPAQLGSILQLASCKSSGTSLKTAKLPDLGQSVMILRKHESTDQFVLETNDSSGNQEVKILPGLVARCGSGAIIAMKQQGKVDGKINSGENLKTGLEGQSSWRFMAASNVNSPISTSTIPSASIGTTSQGSKMKFVTHNIIGSETLLKDQQTAAALVNLKNKYNVMDKDVRFQKSLTEDCQDIDLNVPSTSDHFPETNMMFSPTPTESNGETRETNDASTNKGNHGLAVPHTDLQKDAIDNQVSTEPHSLFHTTTMVSQERCIITQDTPVILQDPSMDSGEGIVLRDSAMVLREPTMVLKESPVVLRESMVLKETPVLLRSPSMILREPTMVLRNEKGEPVDPFSDEGLGLMAVAAEMKGGRIMIDEEEFAREHPNTTFHSEELADEAMVQPFPIVPRGPITDNSAFHHALSKPVILSTEANEQNIEYRDTETMDSTNVYRDQIKIHDLNSGQSCVKSSKKSKPCVRKTAVKSSTFKVSENHLKKIIDTGFAVDLNVSKNEDRLKQLIDDSFGVRQTDNLKLPNPSSFDPDLFWESNNKTIKDDDSTKKPDAFDTLLNKPSTSITKKPKPINKMQLRINSVIKSPKTLISHTNKAISTADSSTPDVLPSVDETKKPPMRTYPSKRAVDARKQAEIVKQEPFATNNVDGLLNTIATSILCGLRDCGTTSTLIRTKEKIDAQTVPQKFNPSEITITKTGVKRFNLNGTVQIPKKKARVRKPVTSIVTPVTMTDSVRLDAQTFVSK